MESSRTAAINAGEARYYTGRPCIRGHIALRDTISGDCLECRTERNREGRAKAKAAIAASANVSV